MTESCKHCGKSLRVFTIHLDWNGRQLHKKCWKEVMDQRNADMIYESTLKEMRQLAKEAQHERLVSQEFINNLKNT